MKTSNIIKVFNTGPKLALLLTASVVNAQGTFRNLDFESANVSGYVPGSTTVPVNSALPGWSVILGPSQVSQVGYDAVTLGDGFLSVIDHFTPTSAPIGGSYSVLLMGAAAGIPPGPPTTISQTGVIPAGTLSLLVKMSVMNAGSSPVVSLQGQNLDLVPLQTFPNYTLYAADIASFAGQSATLSFTAPTPRFGSPSFLTLDDISFLPIAVPEPTTEALLALGGLVLVSRIRRRDR